MTELLSAGISSTSKIRLVQRVEKEIKERTVTLQLNQRTVVPIKMVWTLLMVSECVIAKKIIVDGTQHIPQGPIIFGILLRKKVFSSHLHRHIQEGK